MKEKEKKDSFGAESEQGTIPTQKDKELLSENFPIDLLKKIGLDESTTVEDLKEIVRKNPLPDNFDGEKMLREIGNTIGIDYSEDEE